MTGWLVTLVVLAAVLAIGLRREFARLDEDFARLKVDIGTALQPPMIRLVADIQSFMEAMNKVARQVEAMRPEPRFYWLFRRLHWLPEPAYYWFLDRLTDNDGWRPPSYREGRR